MKLMAHCTDEYSGGPDQYDNAPEQAARVKRDAEPRRGASREELSTHRMAEPGAEGGDRTDHLTGLAVQQMRRRLNWNSRSTGRCTYTLGDGTLLLTSLVEEVIHNEAAATGCPVTDFVPLQPAILAGALAALSDVEWVDPGGTRLIADQVTMLELERQMTDLVRTIDVRISTVDEGHRESLMTLQVKAKEHLAGVRSRASSTALLGERLQGRVVDFEQKRMARAALEESLAALARGKEGNSGYKAEKKALDGALALAKSEQASALMSVRRISAEIDKAPDRVNGDTTFGSHTFNDIARQCNALERTLPLTSPVKAARGPHATPGTSSHASAKTVADLVAARISKSFTGLFGYGEIEWTHDSRDFDKGLWLLAASSVWAYVDKMPGADLQTRLQLLTSCTLDSSLPVPDMLQAFLAEVNHPRLMSSIQDELTTATNADMSCELKLKRIAGLLHMLDKVRNGTPVVSWAGEPADCYAWDSLHRLINGMDLANPQKDKLLEMSATVKSEGLTMADVRNLCRTADISHAFHTKRKMIESRGSNSTAHSFLNNLQAQPKATGQLDSKNGSCSFCCIYGHDQSVCRKRIKAEQEERARSSGLVSTTSLGVWDPARLAALEAKVMQTTMQQQELISRARAMDGSQRTALGQVPAPMSQATGQQPQATDPRLQQAPTGQDGAAGYGGTSQRSQYGGKGRFSPYRPKGRGKGKGWQDPQQCRRCGSKDHTQQACQQPDLRQCYNCGAVGHVSWNCTAPQRQQ